MSKITQIVLITLVILLLISAGINVVQYHNRRPLIIETVTVRDTVSRIDTVVKIVTNRIAVEKPVPVLVDTTSNVRTYRDTIHHQYGTIRREETVMGELLKKDIEFDIKIPEITRTLTINSTVTNTVRSPLLYITGGIRSNAIDQSMVPAIGLLGISQGHRWSAGVDYSFDRQFRITLGYSIVR